MPKPLELTEDQVLYFRAKRGHLAGGGATNVVAAAEAIVGAQSQQLPPSLHALSLRTRGRPRAAQVRSALLDDRALVRTWGQRETLHLYPPGDWPLVAAARAKWAPGGRGGPMPRAAVLDRALAHLHELDRPATRSDLIPLVPAPYVKAIGERARLANMDPKRLGASRLFWCLALRGDVCLADKIGAEQAYVTRRAWQAKLTWPEPDPHEAATALTRRYFHAHGPATVQDVAHFFGARITEARQWVDALEGELMDVTCGERGGLRALARDARTLKGQPGDAKAWPVRLLPLWETTLMAHADKTWTVPDVRERKQVWRKAAYVSAVALARGRVVATWSQTLRARKVIVQLEPLSGWKERTHAPAVKREAAALARHLDVPDVELRS